MNGLKHFFVVPKKFGIFLLTYHNENQNYKNKCTERKYLKMWKNQFLKVKNSLLELEKDFIELKDRESKDVKIKREIKGLFFKPIIVTIDDMDKFEKKEMKKKIPVKKTWYDWLNNYIPKPIRKNVNGFNDKIVSYFKANTPKQTLYGRVKKLNKPRKQIIKKPFISEENKEKIKDRIIGDILKFF